MSDDTDDDYDELEQRIDEINDALLESYRAGYKRALDEREIEPEFDPMVHEYVGECAYYYWEMKVKPWELYLPERFGYDHL